MTALPFLDLSDPSLSTRGPEVTNARESAWAAQTPYGLAVLRYKAVGQILRDRRFRQGSHNWPLTNNLAGPFANFWSNSIIGREGDEHRKLRNLAVPALSADFIATMMPAFDEIAADLCREMSKTDGCEFQSTFATPFAAQAITTLLGMERSDWPIIAKDASDLGLAMGVNCKSHEDTFNAAYQRLRKLSESLIDRVRRGQDTTSYVSRLVALFDKNGGTTLDELVDLVVISIFGGVDTTRSQLGLGLSLLMDNPAQWSALRQNNSLIENTVEEFIRARPTTTWVTRQAVQDVEFEGHTIKAGTVLHLLVHASARDPEICTDPAFDITANRKRHFGFGGGSHHCIGHLMARTDISAALRALVQTFETVSYDGPATWLPDSGNTSPVQLPIKYKRS